MIFHSLEEHFLVYQFALVIIEHPAADLAVPYQCVTTERNSVCTTEVSNLVSVCPVELTFFRFSRLRFHVIFSSDAVVVLLD